TFESAEKHTFTHSLRRPTANEQFSVSCLHWRGHGHSRSSEMRHEFRFGPDVCGAARAVVRKTKHVTLAAGCNNQIDVVEAAIQHSTMERRGKRVLFGYETRDRLC